jgi:phospholipid transport system transporter-binding protein
MFQPNSALTLHNAKTALQAGLQAIQAGETQFDLAQVTAVDSAAVATLIAWQRAATERGATLKFTNLPSSLQSLADLYGVADLLRA